MAPKPSRTVCGGNPERSSEWKGYYAYTGVTSDLVKRGWQHKNDLVDGFCKKYKVHNLVWYEQHEEMESAIIREKQLKKWNRQWKICLINALNPQWTDLYTTIV